MSSKGSRLLGAALPETFCLQQIWRPGINWTLLSADSSENTQFILENTSTIRSHVHRVHVIPEE